jgi:hypothetical protein
LKNFWKESSKTYLQPDKVLRSRTLLTSNRRKYQISGGLPFLRRGLTAVGRRAAIRAPDAGEWGKSAWPSAVGTVENPDPASDGLKRRARPLGKTAKLPRLALSRRQ